MKQSKHSLNYKKQAEQKATGIEKKQLFLTCKLNVFDTEVVAGE